ncbi:hypothetical protein Q5P01_003035 [Channa striata]|uniref:Peptidase S1 domain-containing protein n=1 Tax=Channa striata TaxID=64152 RepID=A0AA88NRJ6_CHASR|nr:hypothetical protein Q5P01_003035 [Channa striata]
MASYKVTCALTLLTLLTPDGEWPWMASLQKDGRHVCGGTLVDEDSVLSSDDCVSSNQTGSNAAVLHLETPTLSNYIQPICVDNGRTFSVGLTCWAAGWSPGQEGVSP